MLRRQSLWPTGLAVVAVALVGVALGLASGRLLRTSAGSEATAVEPAGGWVPVSGAPPDEKSRAETPPVPAAPPTPAAGAVGKRALLVGVTRYDNLAVSSHLNGPANDVALLRTTLVERYGFPPENIVALTEDEAKPGLRPTRVNIAREFGRLAELARPGEQVVVLLAGHGDRQPESDPPDPFTPEPDGLDEIFLPADVKPWKGFPDRVPDAITDKEIRNWLAAITAKKAYVWAVFDCCHSTSMIRESEAVRQLPAGILVPAEEVAKARERAGKRAGRPADAPSREGQVPASPDGLLVATAACREFETTPESLHPAGSAGAKCHGLFTYSLVSELEKTAASGTPVTYRELMQRVQTNYLARPQGAPTPTVDGAGQDRVVLGADRPVRPAVTLTRVRGAFVANVGDLHGVTPGSVLRVYSPAGEKGQPRVLGHVRVEQTRAWDSVVAPVEYKGAPMPSDLPATGLCEVVEVDYAVGHLRLGVEPGKRGPEDLRRRVAAALRGLPEAEGAGFQLVDEPQAAHFLIRVGAAGPELIPASGTRPPVPLPELNAEEFGETLGRKLRTIYRARSLISVASRLEGDRSRGASGPEVNIEVLGHRSKDDPGKVLERPPAGWVFRPGDRVSFRVTNTSKTKRLEVTLLVVDPDYRIHLFHPVRGEVNEALDPGASLPTAIGTISDEPPFGPEQLVVLFTPPTNPPVDYRLLLQPGLKGRGNWPASPLAQLLGRGMHGTGVRSGLTASELDDQGARVLNWRTEPVPK